jgi:hypothetical protein
MNKNQVGDVLKDPKLGKGQWVVIKTRMSGGGTGHGPHDIYPDGWTLTLRKLHKKSNDINWKVPSQEFYQSGSFTSSFMLEDPVLVRKVKVVKTVTLEDI